MKLGYKQTEVGVIPEEWEISLLGDCCGLITKGTTPTSLGKNFVRSGVRFLKAESISETGRSIPDKVAFIDESTHALLKRSQLASGDLLVSIAGVLGRIGLVENTDLPGNTNQALAIVRLGKDSVLDRMFLFYSLRSPVVEKQIRDINVQAAQANISLQNVGDFRLPVPPLPEQRAIATALSDVDGLLGGLDRLIAKKRDLKQAAMQQLLTGQTRLPGWAGAWEVKRLGEVIHLIRGGIYGDERPRAGLIGSSVATTAHIEMDDTWNNKEMPVRYFTAEKLRDYATVEGDLIVVKSSGSAASIQSGKLGFIDTERVGKFVFSNFLMLLRPTGVLPRFLYFYLCSHNVKKLLPTLVEASTYPNIRLGDYLAVEIPVPSLPEQAAIAEVLTEMDAELAGLTQRREKTRALKQAMMQELLTGRTRLI